MGLNREKERPEWIMLWACVRKLWPDDLPGYRYWIYGIFDSQRVGKLIRFLCVFRFSGNKITQRARAQWVEKENRVLLGWYSIDGFTDSGGSSTGPVWFLCRDWSSWRGITLAQKYADERYSRYQIILRKCHSLVADASLQNILIKLVASKEEAEIAKVIEKARKSSRAGESFSPPVTAGRTRGPSYGYRRGRESRRC